MATSRAVPAAESGTEVDAAVALALDARSSAVVDDAAVAVVLGAAVVAVVAAVAAANVSASLLLHAASQAPPASRPVTDRPWRRNARRVAPLEVRQLHRPDSC